jgi:hypothetical protein
LPQLGGPLAIVAATGVHLREPERSPLDILVPVSGTGYRAAPPSLPVVAIARAYARPVTALYVASTTTARKQRRLRARGRGTSHPRDVVRLADRYDVEAKTAVRSNVAPMKRS